MSKLFTAKILDREYNDSFNSVLVADNFWDFACSIENKYLRRVGFELVSIKSEPLTVFRGFEKSIADQADLYNGDFEAFYAADENRATALINYVDQSGDNYCARFALVKHYFKNFYY